MTEYTADPGNTDDSDRLAQVHHLPNRPDTTAAADPAPGSAVTPAEPALEGEVVSDAEFRRRFRDSASYQREKQLFLERYQDYRSAVVWIGQHSAKAARTSAKVTKTGGTPVVRFVRRHGTFVIKGAEAERQRRKAENGQRDARAARAQALRDGDFAQVGQLNEQIQQQRHVRVDTLTKWAELVWMITRKVALALVIALGVALVVGVLNGFGQWMGPWGIGETLDTIGAIIATTAEIVAFSVTHWWAFAAGAGVVWLSRRWRDGTKLGEQVLPEVLRRDAKRTAYLELSENTLVKALANIGHAKLSAQIKDGWPNRDTDQAWVQFPIMAEGGKGYTAKLRLPMSASVADINQKKELLAHNLGCRPQELFLDADPDDPTVLDLFRLEPGVLREPVPPSPLLNEGVTCDFFAGFPVGISPRGNEVTTTVFERNFVYSGTMGSGKTTFVLSKLAAAALDPLVDIDVFVFADNNDFDPLEPVLSTFVKGDTPDNVEGCLEHIRKLHADLANRGKLLVKHDVKEVNREVAAKEPGLRPRLMVIDECQSFFRQGTPEERKQVIDQVVRFYSAARKYGVVLAFATPNPSDASLPRDLVAVTSNKACGAIGDKLRNNVVLGEKAHENGISALGLKPKTRDKLNDAGTLVTVGFMDTPGAVRSYYYTSEQLRQIAARGAELRGGALTPQSVEPQVRDLIEDLNTVMTGEDPVNAGDLVGALRNLAPGHKPYKELTKTKLIAELKEVGIKPPSTGNLYPVDPVTVRQRWSGRAAQLEQGTTGD
ncbi:zonular occludens toxin domain-containing protein [Amycolatopsis magusensis]|uniref:zonular occludens toxin domain-containing protein n=1 Tax=Amycolatopsis magusensis TaxID=882444 RepID=UPI0024A95109|nr:zonular occludens toxin domain-containing protein [Amycolatopsis magusensis]MDI5980113.1 zonular occludens toxin domain-containing protein [Amycolatopsis magusensis]